ncbi:AraC family ligand binding domain-containing protein [Rhodoferax sp.]|uniref:AraC family transcriptional regulator n=1 Tax=Rhodoferax sp. TaxID=50421 RepID=UPI00374D1159
MAALPVHTSNPPQQLQRSALLPYVEMRQVDQADACFHTHSHDEFSFGVVDAGSASYRNRQQVDTVRAGMAVLFNPGDAHACNPERGQRWSYRMLFVDAGWVARLQADTPGVLRSGDYTPFAVAQSQSTQLYQHFGALFDSLLQNGSALAAEEQLVQFLLLHGFDAPRLPAPLAASDSRLQRARELILDQLSDTLRLETIANAAGLNRFQLIRSFKQAYGLTPHAFQLDQRINHGKQLLKRGHTLVDVAQQLGFADQSHFQRHFKSRHAVTPRFYQQALAQG